MTSSTVSAKLPPPPPPEAPPPIQPLPTGTSTSTINKVAPPPQWPAAILEQYEPIRRLGQGGFATVMLARPKHATINRHDPHHTHQEDEEDVLVAIKVVGTDASSPQEHGYAHREMDILQELRHPNIMQVYDVWEAPPHSPGADPSLKCAAVMALSYSRGPTLEQILKFGGAVSLTFGRTVLAQVIDAVAYCHGRAVIHRDIKPDNLIVTGASFHDEDIWEDTDGWMGTDPVDWEKLRQKWHVTLIDFGFARALSPRDIEKEKVTMKEPTRTMSDSRHISRTGSNNLDQSLSGSYHSLTDSRRSSVANTSRHSVSYVLTRKMSALGNRMYAAPEIVNGVQDGSRHGSTSYDLATSRHMIDITKTLSLHVSNYGMLADAFSLGNTLQYMMTGVPPNQNVIETIHNYRSPFMVFCRYVARHCCGGAAQATHQATGDGPVRKYQYRTWSELPKDLVHLIRGMNHPAVSQRISVRAARRYPCVEDIFAGEQEDPETLQHCTPGRIDFLQCVLRDHAANKQSASKRLQQQQKQQQEQQERLELETPGTTILQPEAGAVPVVDEAITEDDQVGLEL